MRETNSRDLGNVRHIKSEDKRVLVKNDETKERLKNYFHKLFNKSILENLI